MTLVLRQAPVATMPAPQPKYYPVSFAPDRDPAWMVNPGVLVDVNNLIPSRRGTLKTHQCAPQQDIGVGGNPIGGDYLYGGIYKNVAGVGRLIIGTTLYLLESDGSTWSNQKTLAATASGFDFTTYGNEIIAVDKANPVQVSTGTTFSDLGGSPPKASCCTTNKNFIILADTDDGVDDFGDRVWWSGIGNPSTWTPSASTQAGNLRIADTPGPIRALVNMRDAVAVYKDDSLYILDYQGSPLLWTPRLISDKVGCAARNGVAVVNGIHYFLHRSGVKRFDGASVQDIGATVNRYLFDKMVEQANFATVQATYDEYEGVILWFFKQNSGASGNRNYALAYNVITGQFGFSQQTWTGDGTGSSGHCEGVLSATLADIASWKSSLGTTIGNVLTIGTDGSGNTAKLRIPVWGTAGQSTTTAITATTGDIGDDVSVTQLSRIQPRLVQCDPDFGGGVYGAGGATNLFVYGKSSQSDAYDTGTEFATSKDKRRFDGLKSAKWLKAVIPIYNYGEIAGVWLTTSAAGSE